MEINTSADLRGLVVLYYMERRLLRSKNIQDYRASIHQAASAVRSDMYCSLRQEDYFNLYVDDIDRVCMCGKISYRRGLYHPLPTLTRHCTHCKGRTPEHTLWTRLVPTWAEELAMILAIILDSGDRRLIQCIQETYPRLQM